MANPELGTKQICPNCQAKFYDLGKRPAHCPKCENDFDPDEAVRNRRVRARTIIPEDDQVEDQVVAKETDDEEEEEEAVTPELDEVVDEPPLVTDDDEDDTAEPGPAVSEDLGEFTDDEEDADDADVPFLEDEDEDEFDETEIDGLPGEGDED